MISSLLACSKTYLDEFYSRLSPQEWECVLELCLKTQGVIYFSGVGKSGFIAKKVAMTLASMGIKSFFLEPLNVLHGDLGLVNSGDIIILFSKSGATKELIELVPYLQKRGGVLIAVTSSKHSPLGKLSEVEVYLPVKHELDEYDLVPTTSTQVQLIFGDILATALMSSKGIGLELYAQLHPAGSIGKKLLTTVDELMIRDEEVPFCQKSIHVKDILIELTQKRCGCVVIADADKRLEGVFTDGDLRRSLQKFGTKALDSPISEFMTRAPIVFSRNKTALEAKKMMQVNHDAWIQVLPIVDEDKVVGLLRMHDILKAGI